VQGLEEPVRLIIAKVAAKEIEQVSLDDPWRKLGLDSLDLFDLLIACEKEFNVEISDAQAINFYRGQDIVNFLRVVATSQTNSKDSLIS